MDSATKGCDVILSFCGAVGCDRGEEMSLELLRGFESDCGVCSAFSSVKPFALRPSNSNLEKPKAEVSVAFFLTTLHMSLQGRVRWKESGLDLHVRHSFHSFLTPQEQVRRIFSLQGLSSGQGG